MFKGDEEIWEEVLDRISEGETTTHICDFHRDGTKRERRSFPRPWTIHSWTIYTNPAYDPQFTIRYCEAKLVQEEVWSDQMVDIADEILMGAETIEETVDQDGEKPYTKTTSRTVTKEMLGHRTLRVNSRARALEMRNPEKWSTKLRQAKADAEASIFEVRGGLPD